MEKVTGVVESKSRKGNSIKVEGEWYSTYKSADLDHVNWKDTVEFLWEAKGEYRNIKGKVEKLSGGSAPASSGAAKPAYSNLGVEVGHASNLAMRMMEQRGALADTAGVIGSPEYYREFTEYTVNMYKVMKAIRSKVESADHASKSAPKPAPKEPSSADVDVDDLF